MGYGWNRNKFAEAKKLDKNNNNKEISPKQERVRRPRSNAFKDFRFFSNSSGTSTGANRDDLEAWKGSGVNQVNDISSRVTARVESVQNVTGRLDRKLEKVEAAGEKFRKKFMKARQQLEEQENNENLRAMTLWNRKNAKKVTNLDDKIKQKTVKNADEKAKQKIETPKQEKSTNQQQIKTESNRTDFNQYPEIKSKLFICLLRLYDFLLSCLKVK